MAATVSALQSELIEELGPMMSVAEMDLTPVAGVIPSLQGPIRKAIVAAGGTVADPPNVTDADVGTVTAGFDALMSLARVALLERIWGNWPHVDMKSGEESQSLSQLAKRLQEMIADAKAELKDPDSVINVIPPGDPYIGLIEEGSYIPNPPFMF